MLSKDKNTYKHTNKQGPHSSHFKISALSQVQQCKTRQFTKEVGLKLGFGQMEQIKLTCLEKLFLLIFMENKSSSKLLYPLFQNLHFKKMAEVTDF